MTSHSISPTTRINPAWILVLTTLALLAGLAMWRTANRAMQMTSPSTGGGQFSALRTGESAKVVLEVTYSTSPINLQGKLLEKKTENTYRRTQQSVEVSFGEKTPIVMGKAADLRPGAVIHVSGTVNAGHVLEAKQIVILMGYVQVQAAQP